MRIAGQNIVYVMLNCYKSNRYKLYFERERVQTTRIEALEKGHGRLEEREYLLETSIDWLTQKPERSNL
jgi:hypothetical protein